MDLNAHAKSAIESLTCPTHQKKPMLVITDGDIFIQTCCIDFKIMCLRELLEVLNEFKKNPLHVAWKSDEE